MPLASGNVYDPLSLQADLIEWEGRVVHNVVIKLKARLDMRQSILKFAKTPQCRIELWAEDSYQGDEELAYCKGRISFGDPKGKVVWLGRSKSRSVRSDIAGNLCVKSRGVGVAAGSSQPARSIATALLGLYAAIAQLFGVVQLELLADDHGSGGLLRHYARLGLVRSHFEECQAIFMMGAAHQLCHNAPEDWFLRLVPADFDGHRWLGRRLGNCRAQSSEVTDGLTHKLSSRSTSDLQAARAAVTAVSQSLPRPITPADGISRTIQRRSMSEAVLGGRPGSASGAIGIRKSVAPIARGSAQSLFQPTEQCAPSRFSCSSSLSETLRKSCDAGDKFHRAKRPQTPSRLRSLAAPPAAPSDQKTASSVPQNIHQPFVAHKLSWSWRVSHPVGSQVCIKFKPSKNNDRLSMDACLRDADGVELVSGHAAIPPQRKFLQVVWLGRSGGLHVHESIRGCPLYSTDSEGAPSGCAASAAKRGFPCESATPAVAILGVLAAIAARLKIDVISVSLQNIDDPSGSLRSFFCRLGFEQVSDDDTTGSQQLLKHDLRACALDLVSRCCPPAWHEEVAKQAVLKPLQQPVRTAAFLLNPAKHLRTRPSASTLTSESAAFA